MSVCPCMRNSSHAYAMRTVYSITVNRATHTLTLYRDGRPVKTYPVGVGKAFTQTPAGTFTIINKAYNPGGPYGARWLGLSAPHYGIHGTNDPSSIGKDVSHGCIRMYNQDVITLYNLVPVGTQVKIL